MRVGDLVLVQNNDMFPADMVPSPNRLTRADRPKRERA